MSANTTNSPDGSRPTRLVRTRFALAQLGRLRQVSTAAARRAGLGQEGSARLVIAVNEAATNAIRHGGGTGVLEIAQDDGHRLIVEVSDRGPGLPPIDEVRPPDTEATSGRGLWLIRQCCDRMRLMTDRTGTTVSMEFALTRA